MVASVSSYDEFKTLIQSEKPVIIDFWATWCGPCKMVGPHFEKWADQYKELDFYKVDIDEQEQIAQELNIRTIPTFIIFQKGEQVKKLNSAKPADLKATIESVIDF